MPTYSYNPLSGEQSGLTAQDRLRQANADRMIQMTLANMQDARAAQQMSAAERLGYAQIAGNKDLATIGGEYGLRGQELANQGQLGIENARGGNAINLAKTQGEYGLAGQKIAGDYGVNVAKINAAPQQTMADLASREADRNYNDKQNSLDAVINNMLVNRMRASVNEQANATPNMSSTPQWQGQGPAMTLVPSSGGAKKGLDWDSFLQKAISAKLGIQPSELDKAKEKLEVEKMISSANPNNEIEKNIGRYNGAKAFVEEDVSNILNNFGNQSYLSNSDIQAFKQYRDGLVAKLKKNGYDDNIVSQILSDVKSKIDSTIQNSWFSSGPQGKQISDLFSSGGVAQTQVVRPTSFSQSMLPLNRPSATKSEPTPEPTIVYSVQPSITQADTGPVEGAKDGSNSNVKSLSTMPKDILYGLAKMIEDLSNGPYKYGR